MEGAREKVYCILYHAMQVYIYEKYRVKPPPGAAV